MLWRARTPGDGLGTGDALARRAPISAEEFETAPNTPARARIAVAFCGHFCTLREVLQ